MRFNGFLKFEEFVENVEFNAERIQHTISHKTGFDNFLRIAIARYRCGTHSFLLTTPLGVDSHLRYWAPIT